MFIFRALMGMCVLPKALAQLSNFFHHEQCCPEHQRWQPPGTHQLANGLAVLVGQHIAVGTPCLRTPPETGVTEQGVISV